MEDVEFRIHCDVVDLGARRLYELESRGLKWIKSDASLTASSVLHNKEIPPIWKTSSVSMVFLSKRCIN